MIKTLIMPSQTNEHLQDSLFNIRQQLNDNRFSHN